MILDKFMTFTGGAGAPSNGDGETDKITTAVAAEASSQTLDLAIVQPALPPSQSSPYAYPFRDIGIGDDPAMKLLVLLTSGWTGGTNVFVALAGAPDNGAGAPGTFVVWYQSSTVTAAQILAGSIRLMDIDMPRPPANDVIPRFLQLQYTSTGTFAGGLLFGGLVLDRHDQIFSAANNGVLSGYAPGIVVAN